MAAGEKAKAWGIKAESEPRWPASLAIVAAAALNFVLPPKFSMGPNWLVPVLVVAILLPLSVVAPHRRPKEARWTQVAAFGLIAVVNMANVVALGLLIHELITNAKNVTGAELLTSAVEIWCTNVVVFALWYWELDRGGPDERLSATHEAPDFLFPQMSVPDCARDQWSPHFVDYFYIAFTNATAFSPTDTLPLTPWAKMLMAAQSAASLVTLAIVASRAVNILG